MTTHSVIPYAAIDLGFFSTKLAVPVLDSASSRVVTAQFPSLAPVAGLQVDLPAMARPDGCVVKVDEIPHFVGEGSYHLLTSSSLTRSATPNYSNTPEYKALFLGALWHAVRLLKLGDRPVKIERLTVGLPVSAMRTHSQSLEALCTGTHQIPGVADPGTDFKVTIGKVHVLSQPQGAMLSVLVDTPELQDETVLVADMGGGTFDWFLAEKMVAKVNRSGSHNEGMLNAALEVCNRIAPELSGNPDVIQRIDDSLRNGSATVKLGGQLVDLSSSLSFADKVISSGLRAMERKVGEMRSIDRVLVTGGGAAMVSRVWPSVFPGSSAVVEVCEEPVYSNVRGFLVYSRSMSASGKRGA